VGFKDFDAARRERDLEEVAFSVGGERFECLPVCPATVLFDYAARDTNTVRQQYEAAVAFIVGVLDDDEERFRKALTSKANPVDYETIAAVVSWLVGHYTGRPTERPSASPSGASATGRSSSKKPKKASGRSAGAPR
jgi:hypothetical protein